MDQAAEVIVQEVLVMKDQETLLPLLVFKEKMVVIQVEVMLEEVVENMPLQSKGLQEEHPEFLQVVQV